MTVIKNMRKKCIMLGLALAVSSSFFCNTTPTLDDNLFFGVSWPDVVDYWQLGNHPLRSLWAKMQFGFYGLWSNSWKLPTQYGTISFKALATDYMFIGTSQFNPWSVADTGEDLYANLVSPQNSYEAIIGPYLSLLFKGFFLAEEDFLAISGEGIPVNPNTGNLIIKLTDYKIIFYHENNKDFIAFYAFNPVTEQWRQLIKYHTENFTPGPRWFSLSSFYSNVFYENIEASNSVELPTPLSTDPIPAS